MKAGVTNVLTSYNTSAYFFHTTLRIGVFPDEKKSSLMRIAKENVCENLRLKKGLNRELNPGPPPISVNPKKESLLDH